MSVPDSLQYRGEKSKATPTLVEHIKMPAEGLNSAGAYTETNNIIRIPIRSDMFLDPTQMFISMRISNTTPAGANTTENDLRTLYFSGGCYSIIKRLRILSGTNVISDIDDYNVLMHNLISNNTSDDYLNSLSILSGYDEYNPGQFVYKTTPVPAGAANAIAETNVLTSFIPYTENLTETTSENNRLTPNNTPGVQDSMFYH